MGRLLRGVLYLAVLGAIGLTAYAFFGDLSPRTGEVRETVVLDGN
jgi:hypothetical protein